MGHFMVLPDAAIAPTRLFTSGGEAAAWLEELREPVRSRVEAGAQVEHQADRR
jgi:hypothetical protein